MGRSRCFRHEHSVPRSVLVRGDKNLAVVDLPAIEEVLSLSDAYGFFVALQIRDVKLRFCPALLYADEKPSAIVRKVHSRPIFSSQVLSKNKRIVCGIAPERVTENPAVINFFTFWYVTFLRIAGVEESRVVQLPGNAGGASAFNGVWQCLACRSVEDVQRAYLGPAWRSSIGDILAIVRRGPPIERESSVRCEFVHVEQHAIFSADGFANQQHRLVLCAFALGVEVIL